MWVMLNDSFYSAIRFDPAKAKQEAPGKTEKVLLIRTRDEASAAKLAKHVGRPFESTKDALADYPFRIQVTRHEWKRFLAIATDGIDYSNFKNSVLNRKLHNAYMRVWSAMHDIEPHRSRPPIVRRSWSSSWGKAPARPIPGRGLASITPPLWDDYETETDGLQDTPETETCDLCGDDYVVDDVEFGVCLDCQDTLATTPFHRLTMEQQEKAEALGI